MTSKTTARAEQVADPVLHPTPSRPLPTQVRSSFANAQEGLPPLLRTFSLDEETGCWEWTGFRFDDHRGNPRAGYGGVRLDPGAKGRAAHRAVYEALVESIPEGKELDHLCRNKGCVNPAHLEPVTHRENSRRTPRHMLVPPGYSAGSLVADYVRARKAKGLTTDPTNRAILGKYVKQIIASGSWEEADLREAVRTFAVTNRHPRFISEWASQIVVEREDKAHEKITQPSESVRPDRSLHRLDVAAVLAQMRAG